MMGLVFDILFYLDGVVLVALIVVLVVQGFNNKRVLLPFIGDLADKWSQPSPD
jgi:hypothetical protein